MIYVYGVSEIQKYGGKGGGAQQCILDFPDDRIMGPSRSDSTIFGSRFSLIKVIPMHYQLSKLSLSIHKVCPSYKEGCKESYKDVFT